MIRLYVASKKLVKEEKDICVRLVLPVEETEIWTALQKTEMTCLDDCEISDVICDIAEANEFLKSLEHDRLDVFELNVFAGLLSALTQNELAVYCENLKAKKPFLIVSKVLQKMDGHRMQKKNFGAVLKKLFLKIWKTEKCIKNMKIYGFYTNMQKTGITVTHQT